MDLLKKDKTNSLVNIFIIKDDKYSNINGGNDIRFFDELINVYFLLKKYANNAPEMKLIPFDIDDGIAI